MKLIKCDACGKEVSPAANSCPSCGHPVKKPSRIKAKPTIAVILLLMIIISIYTEITEEHKETPIQASSEENTTQIQEQAKLPFSITADALISAYDANEVAAEKMINKSPVEITGKIFSIDLDFKKSISLTIYGSDRNNKITTSLSDNQEELAARLTKEQPVKLLCQRTMKVLGSVVGGDCKVTPIELPVSEIKEAGAPDAQVNLSNTPASQNPP